MCNKYLLIVCLLLFVGHTLKGQILTKESAVQQTLESNLGIQIARNNDKIAENNAGILNSGMLPSLTGNAGAGLDVQKIETDLRDGRVVSAENVHTERYNASINLAYTLFDGLGRRYDFRRFQEESNLSDLQVRETIEMTVLQLFTVYYEVARLTENSLNLEGALQISKDRLKRAQYQFDYGQNTGLDVLNAEVDVNNDSINLLNVQQQLRNTRRDLNLVMNKELSSIFEVDTSVFYLPNLSMETIFSESKTNNVQLLIASTNGVIADFNLKGTISNYLPTVGLTGSYGWNKSANDNPGAFALQNNSTGLSGGVNLIWNIFDTGRSITGKKNAAVNYENQELLKRQTELQVERDIANAWDTYQNALFVLNVQRKSLETNQNNFDRTKERYQLGQISSIEFRQAQLNLLNASLAKSQAKYNAKLAELQMLQVGGQLLNVDF